MPRNEAGLTEAKNLLAEQRAQIPAAILPELDAFIVGVEGASNHYGRNIVGDLGALAHDLLTGKNINASKMLAAFYAVR